MKIDKCYDYGCDKNNLSCFVDCNNMYCNIIRLRNLHNKFIMYENLWDENIDTYLFTLRKDFQNKFYEICRNLENEYDKIIKDVDIVN